MTDSTATSRPDHALPPGLTAWGAAALQVLCGLPAAACWMLWPDGMHDTSGQETVTVFVVCTLLVSASALTTLLCSVAAGRRWDRWYWLIAPPVFAAVALARLELLPHH